jgi:sigma-B regulation protein RsbU (phosphoserine phosphatase)
MATIGNRFVREQLEVCRQQLHTAMHESVADPALSGLLREVDSALERVNQGTYGICETCHDTIEEDRLLADPLIRFCLDHLSTEERRSLENDLALASQLQRNLLPQPHVTAGGWEIHYHYQPAGMVSGDYCDLILPENGNGELVFLLGDVSGKGVAASMLMTHLHAMFHSLVGVGMPLEKLLEMANRVFCESTLAGQYATLMCGRATKSGEVELTGAGHLPALHIRKGGVTSVSGTGLPLGMFGNSRYASRTLQVKPGDTLVLYTDGLSEARDDAGTEYGASRLAEFFAEQHGRPPRALADACLEDLSRFSSGTRLTDDLTLMMIHRAA